MTPAEIVEKLNALAAAGTLHGFTIWKTQDGYQANMQTGKSAGWRVRRAETPSEAIALVLAMDFVDEFDDRLGMPPSKISDPPEPEMLAPPDVDEPPLPDETHEEPGIFD